MSERELYEHQQKQIQHLLEYIYKYSPYYSDILDKQPTSLEALPVMTKSTMMENFDRINTKHLLKANIFEFMEQQRNNSTLNLYLNEYSCGLSSGTSGNKGLTVLSKEEVQNYSIVLWARKGIPSHIKKIRILFALRVNNPSFMEVGKFGIKLVYVDYTVPINELIDKINELKLNIIAGPPSLLLQIAKQKQKISVTIDAIISYAEVLYPETKAKLEREFKAPVVQIYQGSEGFIASTCKQGKLHINEDIVLVQLQDIGKESVKKVVVTDLFRQTQPIIKYELNDLIELDKEGCTCGSVFRVIKAIHGRMDDIFYLRHNSTDRDVLLFPDYVRRSIIFASDMIQEYQVIQHDREHIEVRLIMDVANKQEIQGRIMSNLQEYANKIHGKLGDVNFTNITPEPHPISKKLIRVWRRY